MRTIRDKIKDWIERQAPVSGMVILRPRLLNYTPMDKFLSWELEAVLADCPVEHDGRRLD